VIPTAWCGAVTADLVLAVTSRVPHQLEGHEPAEYGRHPVGNVSKLRPDPAAFVHQAHCFAGAAHAHLGDDGTTDLEQAHVPVPLVAGIGPRMVFRVRLEM
jgi:hypothetical protein